MRQADGSDLLGANDPHSASIGIIYVAPGDDRPSVLEAILMQDKLGRNQVAVVLPENSRAFQRPVDFDGLKNMRRGLKMEIIFVAPDAPGPADWVRQRRFTVYSSLDNYVNALQVESSDIGNAKNGNAGKRAALGAAAMGASAATGLAAGGGGGRSRRRSTRPLLACLLIILTLLLLAGIALAPPMGQSSIQNLDEKSVIALIFGLFIVIFLIFFLVRFSFREKPETGTKAQATVLPKHAAFSSSRVSSSPQDILTKNVPISSKPFDLTTPEFRPSIRTRPQSADLESNTRSSQSQQPEKAKIEDHLANQNNAVQQAEKFPITPIISNPVVDQPKRRFDEPEPIQQYLGQVHNSHQTLRKIPISPDAVIKLPDTLPPAQQSINLDKKVHNTNQSHNKPPNNIMKLFYCYAREDKILRDELDKHLGNLKRQNKIRVWHDRDISPGKPWEKEIIDNLNAANIIALLITPDFMNSDFCYSIEMKRALERHSKEEARVIPIILRPCDWKGAPFSELQVLPAEGKAVYSSHWLHHDEAFADIADGIRKVANELLEAH